ncbi:hypothetical protein PZA11_003800 [Diplocarpon coronariae]|uniref:EamA domain-containing protein n=1 Tax=Diplocarpon coronariae TaxID=2795749 RepID=A0A218Z2T0_9HELO|nr:hypothetical protein B2J93_8583 [Marssonina coronariae]
MSVQYAPPRPIPASKPLYDDPEDYLESLQNIPSNCEPALNDGTTRAYLSPSQTKTAEASLLHPEALRRLSASTISSMGRPRSLSPYPIAVAASRTWPDSFWNFWTENQGMLLVTLSQLFGALMNVTARLLELEGEGMHPFQILFARQGLTAIFCTAWMWWQKTPDFPLGARGTRALLCARSISGFFGIFGMYYSLQYLPVADAVVLTFLAPSVASYGCYIFLGEPFPRTAQYASLISLLGVVLIARPTSFLTSSSPDTSTVRANATTAATDPADSASFPVPTSAQRLSAVGIAMLGVLGAAGAFTSIRWIGNSAHPLLSVNYFSVYCTVISILALTLSRPLHISELRFALPAGSRQWTMLVFLGVCGFTMQYLLTRGLAAGGRGNGARATNMIYTNMIFALLLDKLVFGQSPGLWSVAGSALILGSALFVATRKVQVQSIHARLQGYGEEVGEMGGEGEMAMLGREERNGQEMGLRRHDVDVDLDGNRASGAGARPSAT